METPGTTFIATKQQGATNFSAFCNGGSTATFAKFVPSGDNPIPPPAKAMVSR